MLVLFCASSGKSSVENKVFGIGTSGRLRQRGLMKSYMIDDKPIHVTKREITYY